VHYSDTPETFHFLAARDSVPLKSEFKPAVKVLSRKPAPKVVSRQDPITGLEELTIEDDDDDEEKNAGPTAEELKAKTIREREEKQRKYEEVRARLFGTEAKSGASSPGTVTPPAEEGKGRGKGRSRGRGGNFMNQDNRRPESQGGSKELFDPNYTPKPGSVTIQKRGEGSSTSSGRSTPRAVEEGQILRAPKGPDANGKGFGFTARGGKDG
jgi:hypothetical protein